MNFGQRWKKSFMMACTNEEKNQTVNFSAQMNSTVINFPFKGSPFLLRISNLGVNYIIVGKTN